VAIAQNMHREELLPIEKANAFATILKLLKSTDEKTRQKELMGIVNLSENYISLRCLISRDLMKRLKRKL
jgi:ParB-like chromosome segregation protein Spo0J